MMSAALSYAGCGEYNHHESHFLESCFLCNKPLGHNSDIFMYRGNTPFCSEECRQEQMERDEAKEKRWKISSSKKAHRQTTTTAAAAAAAEPTKKPSTTVAVA